MGPEKILIVEDEKIIAFDLQRRLQNFGYHVVDLCASGQEAIEAAETHKPELVLMDIMLEGSLDGIETSRVLKEQFHIPSIFLTAYADEATLERAKQVQPLGYILKPFRERDLHTTIDIALYKNRFDLQLQDQKKWLSAILGTVTDSIIALDNRHRIHYCNASALDILGITMEESRDQLYTEIFSLVDEESLVPVKVLHQQEESFQQKITLNKVMLQSPDGQWYSIEGTVSYLHFHNLPIGQVIIFRDVSQFKALNQKIEHQSRHDQLTGLVNRREFTSILTGLFLDRERRSRPHALLYLDLDQFKLINDTCGHLAGDELLRQVAEIMRKLNYPNILANSRLGGDEFGIIFENSDLTQALEKAWVLKHSLNSHEFIWAGTAFRVKASFGLIPITDEYEDVKAIMAAADDACYLAKEEGGNRIKVYEFHDETFQKRRGEMTWINRLTQALADERFVLYCQTITPIQEGNKLQQKEEILIRLQSEDGILIPPMDFIPAAERYNLMPQIDRWVIRNTMAGWEQIQKRFPLAGMFCINLSGESLADSNFISFIKHEIKKNNVDPERFCFEITETAAIANMAQALTFINELRAVGCSFALDDFGSGLSSFAYLKSLPVDFLKIDGAFVKNIADDKVNRAMVEAIFNVSRVMGLKTIAEYVTNQAIQDNLVTIGIDYAQGFQIARPRPLFGD